MAEVFLDMEANGSHVDFLHRYTTVAGEDVSKMALVLNFSFSGATRTDAGTGMRSGATTWQPFSCEVALDSSNARILQALRQNERIDATLNVFAASAVGDGTTYKYYTVTMKQGRIVNYSIMMDGEDQAMPKVHFGMTFETMAFASEDPAVEYEFDWAGASSV